MKLSIVTINYNNAEGLRKTMESVLAQTYTEIEYIIVDGASTDGSVDVIRELATRPTIKWVSEKDTGIYNAMNKGLEIALGKRVVNDDHTSSPNSPIASSPHRLSDYIQILNSGDILAADDVTERMFQAIASYSEQSERSTGEAELQQSDLLPILYGNMIKEYPDGRRVKDTCGGGDYTPESFYYFYRGTLNHDCAYIRRDLFEKYGLYNEDMKICSDWEWYVRAIVLGGEKTVYTNIDVTVFDMTGISESNGKNKDIILKERREYLESILPAAVLRDYDMYSLPIEQYRRLKKHHLWGIIYFVERVLFKFEKWSK